MKDIKLLEKELQEKIGEKAYNMAINELFYDLEKLKKIKTEILCKVFLGKETKKELFELEAIDRVLEHHNQGKKISELRNWN